jgi:PTS system mannose-specific IIA component
MIGLVLASWGDLAKAVLAALNDTAGSQPQAAFVSITGNNAESQRQQMIAAIKSVDTGKGVLLFVDDMDGPAGHLTLSLFPHVNIEVISGMNMPMLKKVALRRENISLKNLAEFARDAGRTAINWRTA